MKGIRTVPAHGELFMSSLGGSYLYFFCKLQFPFLSPFLFDFKTLFTLEILALLCWKYILLHHFLFTAKCQDGWIQKTLVIDYNA